MKTYHEHATKRMAQRNLSTGEIEKVIEYGRKIHRTGAIFYFLGRRDLPADSRREDEKLVGTTVIVYCDEVKTAYRNRAAWRNIKRKPKHKRFCGSEKRGH